MNKLGIYKCPVCGNIVTVLHVGGGPLACCGQPMQLLAANTTDAAGEKHVPVVEKIEGGFRVKVGAVPHPMQPEHFIEWIELTAGSQTLLHFLEPGREPVAEFALSADTADARAYCNLHGLWQA